MKLPKETKKIVQASRAKPPRRHGKWYDDACGTAFAMELIGERWSLLIVRELIFGGRRFTDLRAGLPGISAKVLTERLDSLVTAGIVHRRQLPPPAPAQVYELTDWGYSAEPAIKALGYWAATSPDHDPTLPLSPASFMLSLRTLYDGARAAAGLRLSGGLAIGTDRFVVEVHDRLLRAERGTIARPDFTLIAPVAMPLAAIVYGKVPIVALALDGVKFSGDADAATSFVDLFHLPAKFERHASANE